MQPTNTFTTNEALGTFQRKFDERLTLIETYTDANRSYVKRKTESLVTKLLASGKPDHSIKLIDQARVKFEAPNYLQNKEVEALAKTENPELSPRLLRHAQSLVVQALQRIDNPEYSDELLRRVSAIEAIDWLSQVNLLNPNWEKKMELTGHTGYVWAIAALPGDRLATASGDGTIMFWDHKKGGRPLHRADQHNGGHTTCVRTLAKLPQQQLASGSHDRTVKIWNLIDYSCRFTLTGHEGRIEALAPLSDGALLASASLEDKKIIIWDPQKGAPIREFTTAHTDGIQTLITLSSNTLVSGSYDRSFIHLDWLTRDTKQIPNAHQECVFTLLKLSKDRFASGSKDKSISIWQKGRSTSIKNLLEHTNVVNCLTNLPHQKFASGSDDGTVRIWDEDTLKCTQTLPHQSQQVRGLAEMPGNGLAAGVANNIAIWKRKWSPQSLELLRHLHDLLITQDEGRQKAYDYLIELIEAYRNLENWDAIHSVLETHYSNTTDSSLLSYHREALEKRGFLDKALLKSIRLAQLCPQDPHHLTKAAEMTCALSEKARSERAATDARLDALTQALQALSSRVTTEEGKTGALETRVGQIEARADQY